MVKKKAPSGEQLSKATAEKIFGWKNVHKHEGELIGKKQDKAGRWRTGKVPAYSTDASQAYAIDERRSLAAWSATIKSFPRLRRRKIFHRSGQRRSNGAERR
jgi:hypothetical protein